MCCGKTVPVETTKPRQDMPSGTTEPVCVKWKAPRQRPFLIITGMPLFSPPLVGGYGVGQQYSSENVLLSPEQHICNICMNGQLSERSRRGQAPNCPVSSK